MEAAELTVGVLGPWAGLEWFWPSPSGAISPVIELASLVVIDLNEARDCFLDWLLHESYDPTIVIESQWCL